MTSTRYKRVFSGLLLIGAQLLVWSVAAAQAPPTPATAAPAPATEPALAGAPVVVDGVTLFRVRGVSSLPADERAAAIADRIRAVARDSTVATNTLRIVPAERSSNIVMGDSPIMSVLEGLARDGAMDAVIVTGGTGLAPRDVTYEAVNRVLQKTMDGFGELFRMLSYEQIGSAAMLSRALAGVLGSMLVFALPGSPADAALGATRPATVSGPSPDPGSARPLN